MIDSLFILSLVIAFVGGVVRGSTGFGAALVMTPVLSMLIGAKIAVPIIIILETFAAAQMLPASLSIVRWQVIFPVIAAAFLTVPLGVLFLLLVSPSIMQQIISCVVLIFTFCLFFLPRYIVKKKLSLSFGVGAISGIMGGATGIGAPPVILYLLSSTDNISVTRANLTIYIVALSGASLLAWSYSGLLNEFILIKASFLVLPFACGVFIGSKLFEKFSDKNFRSFSLILIFFSALGSFFY